MGYESQKTRFITYKNGENAIGFNITASAYAFVKDQGGTSKEDKIYLNAHRTNLRDDIEWFGKDPDGNFNKIGSGEILEIKQSGEYKATCGDYEDFVTILEVQDGSSAISITLSNPSMVFSNISAGESQECEVIVLEGAKPLNYSKTEFDNLRKSEFTIEITDEDKPEPEQIEGESGRTRCIITILDSVASGSKKLIVKGKNSAGINFSQILTIYWTVASGGLVLSLDNDSDVFVTNADGTSFSSPIEVTPILTRDGIKEDVEFSLISLPDSFKDGNSINGEYASFDKKKLTISKIPAGFEHGIFTFEWGNLRTSFTLRAVQSNVDYNLWIDKTVINNTNTDENSGDKIKVRIQKTDDKGTTSFLAENSLLKEGLFIAVEGGDGSNTWNRDDIGDYYSIGYFTGSEQGPIHIVLNGNSEVQGDYFTWDEETIDFVQNGQTIQDFYITPTSYVFVKAASEQGSINLIQINAYAKNLGDGQIHWYRKNSENPDGYDDLDYTGNSIKVYREGEGNTIVGPGTYLAKFNNEDMWKDEVTIGEVLDGESAINVVLTNPSMTFNSNSTEEAEECQVIIYKGLDTVEATYYEITSEEQDSYSDINGNVITISHQTTKGSKTFTITRSTEGNNPLPEGFSQNITIYWTVVDDGRYSNVVAEPNVLVIDSTSDVKVYLYERVGGKDQEQIVDNLDEQYTCKYSYYNKEGSLVSTGFYPAIWNTDGECFTVEQKEDQTSAASLQITVYKDSNVWGKTTINILESVSRRDHTIYHDAYSELNEEANGGTDVNGEYVKPQFNPKTKLPILPDEKDYTEFPTYVDRNDLEYIVKGCRGWYIDQKEYIEDENGNITGSVYLASKQNSYSDEEQWDKPWYGPREIKQTPLTYDYWYSKLVEEMGENKNKGIYPLDDGVLGINASLIRTGALRIYPFKPENPSDETEAPVFETGWEAMYDEDGNLTGYNTEEPYVKIGGVNFTGLVPVSTKQLSGPNLLISDENGIHLYNSNPITWAANKEYEGYKIELNGKHLNPNYVDSAQEVFYRFMDPNSSKNTLYSLKAGQTYTLTGKAKISGGVEGEVLKFRSLVSDGSDWENYEFFDIVTRTNKQSGDSDDANISVLFKVPEGAKGFCFSFQLYNENGVVKELSYEGTIILEDLRLLENTLDVSGGYSWKFDQQDGLMMWSGPQGTGDSSTDSNLMFKIYKENDEGKLWLKGDGEFTGKITATSGDIAGFKISSIDMTMYGDAEGQKVKAFISKQPQQGTYSVGNSGFINTWYMWNTKTAGSNVGNFGVTQDGILYANDAVISGNITANSGYIGGESGWKIETGGLSYENENGAKIIYLGPTPLGGYQIDDNPINVVFKIGDNFLVDTEGKLYATDVNDSSKLSGGITTISIMGDITQAKDSATQAKDSATQALTVAAGTSVMVDNTYYGRNLLLDSEKKVQLYSGDYTYKIATPLVAGKNYTFSFEVVSNGNYGKDMFTLYFGEENNYWFEENCTLESNAEKLSHSFQLVIDEAHQSTPITFFKIKKQSNTQVTFCKAKLELGNSATDWSPAPEEADPLNVNSSNYSWLFSKTEGLKMWNGAQKTDEGFDNDENLVFKIDDTGLLMRGRGVFDNATILGDFTVGEYATKGDISQVETNFFMGRNLLLNTMNSFYVNTRGIESTIKPKLTISLKKDQKYTIKASVTSVNSVDYFRIPGLEQYIYLNELRNGIAFTPEEDILNFNLYSNDGFCTLSELKLELGGSATPWTMAPEEDPLNVNGIYSWHFSPSSGVSMSFDKLIDENKNTWETIDVFKVDNTGLFIKGEIEADSGSFGNLSIVDDKDGLGPYIICNSDASSSDYSRIKIGLKGIELSGAASDSAYNTKLSNGSLKIETESSFLFINQYGFFTQNAEITGANGYYQTLDIYNGTIGWSFSPKGLTGSHEWAIGFHETRGPYIYRQTSNQKNRYLLFSSIFSALLDYTFDDYKDLA